MFNVFIVNFSRMSNNHLNISFVIYAITLQLLRNTQLRFIIALNSEPHKNPYALLGFKLFTLLYL